MLKIGSLIDGKYRILSEVGHGGMSVVYMAINEKANKTWAIKEVRKDGVKDFSVVKQGLIVETEMLKRLKHPNLPSIIDVIEDDETFLIVMDYIEGNTLSKALEEYGAQPQDSVIEWAKQLCDVLGYLHTRTPAIIYRDMKPSNIMLKPDGKIMLIDFGTAREFKEQNIADTTCLGTIGYAAPEQFGGMGQTDARTDIYCLGATLYHLLTGCNPCEPPYEIRPIREINSSLSVGLEKIILKCTQRNPNDRYQSCAELMYDLEHYDEMDDIHRKKQKKKVFLFSSSVLLTIVFGVTSIISYNMAQEKKSENYTYLINVADDTAKDQNTRCELYLNAIETDPTRTEAYINMIDMFLTGENRELSKDEASVITQLKAGVNINGGNGYSNTIYPLEDLKAKNKQGYEEVCYQIGLAYWYDYVVESARYTSAKEWFKESVDEYPISQIFCDMGDCYYNINKYYSQNKTIKMNEEYRKLWEKIKSMDSTLAKDLEKSNSARIYDDDTVLLIWLDIVGVIENNTQRFISANVKPNEIIEFLDKIKSQADNIKENSQYDLLAYETLNNNILSVSEKIKASL